MENNNYTTQIKKFGDLKVGDRIIGSDGKIVTITAAYDEHIPDSMYEITVDSGAVIKASGNHLWYVITNNDYTLHRYRLALGKKLGKTIAKESVELLKELSEAEAKEVSIREMLMGMGGNLNNEPLIGALVRTAESVGPIAERNYYIDYLEKEADPLYESTVILYDSKRFAQQLLSLFNIENYRKKYKVIVGRVVSTEDIFEMDIKDLCIPDPGTAE